MRFKLTLVKQSTNKSGNYIPINYQYELSAWIYKVLNTENPEFADWLHQKGYLNNSKQFKLFTFSHLNIPKRNIQDDKIQILSNEVFLTVSFLPVETIDVFIRGLFKAQHLGLGNKQYQTDFQVQSIEKEPEIQLASVMRYRCISPLVIGEKRENSKNDKYLSPEDENFEAVFAENLISKYLSFNKQQFKLDELTPLKFTLLNKPRKKGITIKAGTPQETKVIGYMFDFELAAPPNMQSAGYYAGFGQENSQGFGCVEVLT